MYYRRPRMQNVPRDRRDVTGDTHDVITAPPLGQPWAVAITTHHDQGLKLEPVSARRVDERGRYSDIVCNCKHHNHNNVFNCKHSPSATLDLLILLLVLFSGAFLLSSYFSYIFHSLSLLLPSLPLSYLLPFFLFFALSLAAADFCCGPRSRRYQRSGCKGLKKAMEFDLQIHRFGSAPSPDASAEIDRLPWKGGTEANHDYECLCFELRKMAPPVVD
ncbi:hypothetical protein VIGAN_08151000 [Vigna angularis var. angularis]|uniref:Uncharacterized protein n=1 Tax=Vigna angularis var. angularis TaxID=157739 RepID=A0A0S3SPU7_PHAAN|nr:hypothetical protein VIGAN_08151000 [Vigna angularis var. angularis]